VILKNQPGFIVRLVPSLQVAVQNGWAHIAVEIEWLFGSVTFGLMTKKWIKNWREIRQEQHETAAKQGLTYKQFMLKR
jgi:hypothetical protein